MYDTELTEKNTHLHHKTVLHHIYMQTLVLYLSVVFQLSNTPNSVFSTGLSFRNNLIYEICVHSVSGYKNTQVFLLSAYYLADTEQALACNNLNNPLALVHFLFHLFTSKPNPKLILKLALNLILNL